MAARRAADGMGGTISEAAQRSFTQAHRQPYCPLQYFAGAVCEDNGVREKE